MAKSITPEMMAASGTESGHQKALFCWAALSGIVELRWLFAIPNGGFRNGREAANLVAGGVRSGVPDIFLPVPRGGYSGLWIELKKMGGRPSPAQIEWIDYLNKAGYKADVAEGWEEAHNQILRYLGRIF